MTCDGKTMIANVTQLIELGKNVLTLGGQYDEQEQYNVGSETLAQTWLSMTEETAKDWCGIAWTFEVVA